MAVVTFHCKITEITHDPGVAAVPPSLQSRMRLEVEAVRPEGSPTVMSGQGFGSAAQGLAW